MIKIIKLLFIINFHLPIFPFRSHIRFENCRKIFSHIFNFIGPILKSKKTIEKNLNIFSKDISKSEKEKIINLMWKNYGMTFIEYLFLNKFRKNNSHMNIKNEKLLIEINKQKKPVIFVSGHFANFELMSMEINKQNEFS